MSRKKKPINLRPPYDPSLHIFPVPHFHYKKIQEEICFCCGRTFDKMSMWVATNVQYTFVDIQCIPTLYICNICSKNTIDGAKQAFIRQIHQIIESNE